jgi:hypothetical protein
MQGFEQASLPKVPSSFKDFRALCCRESRGWKMVRAQAARGAKMTPRTVLR